MRADPGQILKAALSLPPEGRAAIAGSLLDSLDSEVDETSEQEWRVEVNKRIGELDTGTARTIPWPEVRLRLKQQSRS